MRVGLLLGLWVRRRGGRAAWAQLDDGQPFFVQDDVQDVRVEGELLVCKLDSRLVATPLSELRSSSPPLMSSHRPDLRTQDDDAESETPRTQIWRGDRLVWQAEPLARSNLVEIMRGGVPRLAEIPGAVLALRTALAAESVQEDVVLYFAL